MQIIRGGVEMRQQLPGLILVLALGVIIRMLLPLRGHNFDIESYRIVANIVAGGGNVYAETARYNYGPIWFYILHLLDSIPLFIHSQVLSFHYKVASFLTLVDVAIFFVLFFRYGLVVGALFFLSPISMIISGYHSQFDNLAIMLGLVSIPFLEKGRGKFLVGLIVLGLSLSVKHVLFLFPIWVALKQSSWSRKLLAVLIPYGLFLLLFVFYLPQGMSGIVNNVFLYRSFSNAPFWDIFAPRIVFSVVSPFFLMVSAMLLLGVMSRKNMLLDSFNLYLASVVLFSSAITNQYLAICVPAIATQWNYFYAFYTGVGSYLLSVNAHGPHLIPDNFFLHWGGHGGYHIMILFLFLGLMTASLPITLKLSIRSALIRLFRWLYVELLVQSKCPWRSRP